MVWYCISASALLVSFVFQLLQVALRWALPSLHLSRSFGSECAVFLLRVNTLAWLPFLTVTVTYCHSHLGTSVWHSSDVLWSSPKKTKLWDTAIGIVYQPGTLGVKFVAGVAELGSHSSSWLLLAMTLCLLTFLLLKSRKEGWFLVTKIGSEWTDTWRIARGYRASPSWAADMFLVWQSTVEFVFTWKVALKEMAPTKEKLFLGFFLFCVGFLKVEYLLEAYVLECVWMVMVQLRHLYQGRGWDVRSTWSLN